MSQRDKYIAQLELERKTLLLALEFYADAKRYEGSNKEPLPNDPHQPLGLPYRLDVIRDAGQIARLAIYKVTP